MVLPAVERGAQFTRYIALCCERESSEITHFDSIAQSGSQVRFTVGPLLVVDTVAVQTAMRVERQWEGCRPSFWKQDVARSQFSHLTIGVSHKSVISMAKVGEGRDCAAIDGRRKVACMPCQPVIPKVNR